MTELIAKARYLRTAPRKMRAVADVVRGMKVTEALEQLRFTDKRASRPMSKLLRSALANAEHNFSLAKESLRIKKLNVDGGPILKRYQPRAYGRAVPIRHRTSHITVVLEGRAAPTPTRPKPAATPPGPKPATPREPLKTAEKEQPEFKVQKKVGEERKPSFVRRLFRRKSV